MHAIDIYKPHEHDDKHFEYFFIDIIFSITFVHRNVFFYYFRVIFNNLIAGI